MTSHFSGFSLTGFTSRHLESKIYHSFVWCNFDPVPCSPVAGYNAAHHVLHVLVYSEGVGQTWRGQHPPFRSFTNF